MTKNRTITLNIFILAIFLLFTTNAYANGIPAYFGTVFLHVIFINILVIAVECFLMVSFSKTESLFRFILLANLVSLFAAYPFTDFFIHSLHIQQWFGLSKNGTISKPIFLLGAGIFILLTIFIEWPFYYFAAKKKFNWLKALKYSFLINLSTNIPIAIYYIFTGNYQPMAD